MDAATMGSACAPARPDEQRPALACWVFQIMLGQEVPPALWAALRLRVMAQADGTAAAVFTLNGRVYQVQRPTAPAIGAGGWLISCPRHSSALLVVHRFQDALLALVGAIVRSLRPYRSSVSPDAAGVGLPDRAV